jgi:hypothetical protein
MTSSNGLTRRPRPGARRRRVHPHRRAVAELARHDQSRDRRLDFPLNHALERAAPRRQGRSRRGPGGLEPFRDLDRDPTLSEATTQPLELDLDDLPELRLRERAEHHDLVDTVQELRPELASQRLEHLLPHPLIASLVGVPHLEDELAADIGGHDDDRCS